MSCVLLRSDTEAQVCSRRGNYSGLEKEEEDIGLWPVQINYDIFATGQILKKRYLKTGRSCEGADISWLSSKVSRTLFLALSIFACHRPLQV